MLVPSVARTRRSSSGQAKMNDMFDQITEQDQSVCVDECKLMMDYH